MKDELLMIDENIASVSDALNKGALAFLGSCFAYGRQTEGDGLQCP